MRKAFKTTGFDMQFNLSNSGMDPQTFHLAGIEDKVAATVTAADFRGMQKMKQAAGKRFKAGVVLYNGESAAPFGDDLYALPISQLSEAA